MSTPATTTPETNAAPSVERPPKRSGWRRGLRIALYAVLAVLILVAAAPYLLNVGPLRSAVLGVATRNIHGRVQVGSTSLGWFSPVAVHDLAIVPDDGGEPLLSVPAISGDRPLWRLVFDRSELGEFRIERPAVRVEATESGSNFTEVFGRPEEEESPDEEPAPLPDLGVKLTIVDATVAIRGRGAQQDLQIPGINVTAGLARSATAGRSSEFVMARGKPIDHLAITPELCNDLLKYIAPVLADSTKASGEFSIEVEDVVLPLDDPGAGQLAGTFSIHAVRVGPGPLVRELAASLGVPAEIQLANESVVSFEMIDGRVYHEGLRFGFPRLAVSTHGSVGLDQTLDLVAEVPLAALAKEGAPLREALSEQTLRIPIRGTLEKPEVDAAAFGENGLDVLFGTLQELMQDDTITLETLMEQLRSRGLFDGENAGVPIFGPGGMLSRGGRRAPAEGGDTGSDESADDGSTEDSGGGIFGGRLFPRRRRGAATDAAPPAQPSPAPDPATAPQGADDGASSTTPPPGSSTRGERPVRRLLRRAIDVAGEAAVEAVEQAAQDSSRPASEESDKEPVDERESPEELPAPTP